MSLFGLMMLVFAVTLFLGCPIAICIGLSIAFALIREGISLEFIAQMCFAGLDNFTFLAIPMFILTGFLMETGGLSRRLISFASSLVGNITGGIGIVTVVACMFFAAISGSSPATVAAIGSMMIPSMVREGYDADFAGALTSCSGSLGILIPPSIPMILYGVTGGVSIGEMFMAGFVPGAVVGLGLMLTVFLISKKRGYRPTGTPFSLRGVGLAFKNAVWALATPVLILGGIYSGVFTPTEAATVSVLYSLGVGLFVHRELAVRDLPGILINAAVTTGAVLIILGFATAFARFITIQQIPQMIGQAVLALSSDPTIILCIFVALILLTGMFIETGAQILIYTPLFLPILTQMGVDPIHFGIILIIGTEISLITPPVGVNLFVAQGISGSSIGNLTRSILPFLCSMLIAQLLLVLFPKLVLILPELFYRS